MNLARMQDIGGIRIVLANVAEVYRLHTNILNSKRPFEHEPLLPPKDYIKEPKSDGYRSLHQGIFKYKKVRPTPELDGLQIELQIRTKLQHAWATAVETLGIIEKSSLRLVRVARNLSGFLCLLVLYFHTMKDTILPILADIPIKEIAKELRALEAKLQIFAKLQGLIVTAKHIETSSPKSDEYHLMELDTSKESPAISLIPFTKSQLEMAESIYKMREIETQDKPYIELVLISAGNLKEIKKPIQTIF